MEEKIDKNKSMLKKVEPGYPDRSKYRNPDRPVGHIKTEAELVYKHEGVEIDGEIYVVAPYIWETRMHERPDFATLSDLEFSSDDESIAKNAATYVPAEQCSTTSPGTVEKEKETLIIKKESEENVISEKKSPKDKKGHDSSEIFEIEASVSHMDIKEKHKKKNKAKKVKKEKKDDYPDNSSSDDSRSSSSSSRKHKLVRSLPLPSPEQSPERSLERSPDRYLDVKSKDEPFDQPQHLFGSDYCDIEQKKTDGTVFTEAQLHEFDQLMDDIVDEVVYKTLHETEQKTTDEAVCKEANISPEIEQMVSDMVDEAFKTWDENEQKTTDEAACKEANIPPEIEQETTDDVFKEAKTVYETEEKIEEKVDKKKSILERKLDTTYRITRYASGDVHLMSSKDIKGSVAVTTEQQTSHEIMAFVEMAENDFQMALSENYEATLGTTFKALRRELPVTRSKFDWGSFYKYDIKKKIQKFDSHQRC